MTSTFKELRVVHSMILALKKKNKKNTQSVIYCLAGGVADALIAPPDLYYMYYSNVF